MLTPEEFDAWERDSKDQLAIVRIARDAVKNHGYLLDDNQRLRQRISDLEAELGKARWAQ